MDPQPPSEGRVRQEASERQSNAKGDGFRRVTGLGFKSRSLGDWEFRGLGCFPPAA